MFDGKEWALPVLAKQHGLKPRTLYQRIFQYKMPIVEAVLTPVGEHKRRQNGKYKIGTASRRCPGNAHWAVRKLFELIEQEQIPLNLLAKRTGIVRETIGAWRYNGNPCFQNIEACFNVLGYKFIVIEKKQKLAE